MILLMVGVVLAQDSRTCLPVTEPWTDQVNNGAHFVWCTY